MHTPVAIGVMVLAALCAAGAWAVDPSADELATAQQWAQARFEGVKPAAPAPGIEVVQNHDPVRKNGRSGATFKLGDATFGRGLFCHAPSELIVRLPGPGKAFTAVVGVDALAGGGSVVASVSFGGKKAFESAVMHGGEAGAAVAVDLAGAQEFTLAASDAGDGIACDQVDWADAKVVLQSGAEVWLNDLAIAQSPVAMPSDAPFFSFTYGGKSSAELLPKWKLERTKKALDPQRTQHTLRYTDPETGLEIRCEAIQYNDFPTVEWTLYFKNAGNADSPILENIQALELDMRRGDLDEFVLHHNAGSLADGNDYSPRVTRLEPNSTKRIQGTGGRPTNADWSYFNVQSTCSDGLIVSVGWPGQWAADLIRDGEKGLHIRAGLELTHFKLLPGEEVRSPLIVLQFWNWNPATTDSPDLRARYGAQAWVLHAQNVWRRWMMAHSMPMPGGELPKPMLSASSSRAYEEMKGANEENQLMFIKRFIDERFGLDYWWMDAGWYIQREGWPQVGTWEIDTARFPRGFKPISDFAHANGIKIIVWFEPERVAHNTWLTQNHPEWILGGANGGLLNLGNPEAWNWLVNHIDTFITESGIDLYRQDFNMDPLNFWRNNDAEDRQGITEIKHVTGYLAYWDELRRRHPNMLIDSCASGGRRNDVETMRRAVPLWRSDCAFATTPHQSMTYGISMWLPYYGTGTVACVNAPYYGANWTPVEPYAFWSNNCPALGSGFDMRVPNLDYDALRALMSQRRRITPYYYGDYYPLTAHSMANDVWMAWQFDLAEKGEGAVHAFRREQCIYESARLPLFGLDPAARYHFEDVANAERAIDMGGAEAIEKGLPIAITERPGAAVWVYKKM